MADLTEIESYDVGVYQFEDTDPVVGGPDGVDNKPTKNLANRTKWLKARVDELIDELLLLAKINSPAFAGNPTAPTPARFDADLSISTTEFVKRAGKSFSSTFLLNSNRALTPEYVGALVLIAGDGLLLDLPPAASMRNGDAISFLCWGWSSGSTIRPIGTDRIYPTGATGGIGALAMGIAETITMVSDGANGWYCADGNAAQKYSSSFRASLLGSGYQVLPSGLILQWGSVVNSATPNAPTHVTFPIAYPNAVLIVINGVHNNTASYVSEFYETVSGFDSYGTVANLQSKWLAIGY